MQADKICLALYNALKEGDISAKAHSVFKNAVNYETRLGMVTLLSNSVTLQPYGVKVRNEIQSVGEECTFTLYGIYDSDGTSVVSFAGVCPVNLGVSPNTPANPGYAEEIKNYLGGMKEFCLAPLVIKKAHNEYTRFLGPRLEEFRAAAVSGEEETIAKCAGCGIGLTPSSDDFLSGYLAMLYVQGIITLSRLARLSAIAASHTNEISAGIFNNLGKGLVSEAVLSLLNAICAEQPCPEEIKRVASIGCTSGGDILTGIYFGLLDYRKVII